MRISPLLIPVIVRFEKLKKWVTAEGKPHILVTLAPPWEGWGFCKTPPWEGKASSHYYCESQFFVMALYFDQNYFPQLNHYFGQKIMPYEWQLSGQLYHQVDIVSYRHVDITSSGRLRIEKT